MKKIMAIILSLVLAFSLAACGSNDGNLNTQKDSKDTEQSVSAGIEQPEGTDSGKTADSASDGKASSGEIKELEKTYTNLTEDELKWEYDSAAQTIVISGEGPMKEYLENAPEWDKYCDEARKVIIGKDVTSVGAGAFLWFSCLEEVELGEKVEFVGDAAFSNCSCLRTVNFPSGLKYVGAAAFNNALLHSDSGFTFPEGMLYIGGEGFRSAFKENAVTIPASLSYIEEGAFANTFVSAFNVDEANPSYTSVDGVLYNKDVTTLINYPADKQEAKYEIPGTVTAILQEAITVTNTLENVVIPASVTNIEEGSIFWNYGLKTIDVDEANSSFKSVDGVLFSKDGKRLISYPLASDRTEYTVPEGTERICNYSMSQANNLTELHIGQGVKEIGGLGCYFCQNLKKLGLPGSIESIEDEAFMFCDALTEINYTGTSADWQNVSIGEDNDRLYDGSVPIRCAE